jgi:hypothetical protein
MNSTPNIPNGADYDNQVIAVLLKDYELAASRFDKTDDRIIQLISVGLAFFGLVVVLLRQTQSSPSGATALPSTQSWVIATSSPQVTDPLLYVIWSSLLFSTVYFGLLIFCATLWLSGSKPRTNPQPNQGTSKQTGKLAKWLVSKRLANELEVEVTGSVWWNFVLGWFIGLFCIFIIGYCIKPILPSDPNAHPSLELLWLAPLSLVAFHALLIYIMYSAIGLLWYCRALSRRMTVILSKRQPANRGQTVPLMGIAYRSVLMRFELQLPPSSFFSFGRGNVKPRSIYVLLLFIIGFLFLWVTITAFLYIYAKNWWEGAIFLSVYLALEFIIIFAFSGVGHDLATEHKKFVENVERSTAS